MKTTLSNSYFGRILFLGSALALAGALSACSGANSLKTETPSTGNTPSGGSNPTQGGNDQTGGQNGGQTNGPSWNDVNLNAKVDGGDQNGKIVVMLEKETQTLLLIMPLPISLLVPDMPIKELPGASLVNYQRSDGSVALAVRVPLKALIKGVAWQNPQKLPNGDNLPYFPAGEPPRFGVKFYEKDKVRLYLYLGVNAAALYVESSELGLPFGVLYPVKDKEQNRIVGAFGLVPEKSTFWGGIYLAAKLPDDVARSLAQILP